MTPPPSPLSPPLPPSSSVEYSKVRSTDPEDGPFEIDNPKSKQFYDQSPSCFHDRCTRSVLACVVATTAGTCLLLLFVIHVLSRPTTPVRNPNTNAIPRLSPNPSPVEASSPSYSLVPPSPSPSPSISPSLSPSPTPSSARSVVLSLTSLCNATQDSVFCIKTLESYPRSEGGTVSLTDLTGYVVAGAMYAVNRTYMLSKDLFESRNGTNGELTVLQDCVEVLDASMDRLKDVKDLLPHLDVTSKVQIMNVRVWLSAAYTDQDTCWDEFGDAGGGPVADQMNEEGGGIAPLLSLALSFALTVQDHSPAIVYIPLLPPSPLPSP